MVINRDSLMDFYPILGMVSKKISQHGVTYGMSEAGYDIRIKQAVTFDRGFFGSRTVTVREPMGPRYRSKGRFALASAIEAFCMPNELVAIVHDKSTWARRGLSVLNTCIEPGWRGFLTLELIYHGEGRLHIPAGAGIAQVVFHKTSDLAHYSGRYQDQQDAPQAAIAS